MGFKKRSRIACLAGVLLVAPLLPTPAFAQTWDSAGSLSLARNGEATLLTDGRVLITGGNTAVGNGYDTKLAEIYDPASNSWSTAGSTTNGRSAGHTATLLPDGHVLVTGGVNANVCTSDSTAELYDPGSGTWSFTGSLTAARYYGTATRLDNGTVLVNGGGNRCGSVFSSSELYDPDAETWSPTGSMTTPREFLASIRLADGRVLALGGAGANPFCAQSTAEVYDPSTGTWTATASMTTPRIHPMLALLPDGRVMAAGGYSGCANSTFPNAPDVEIYNPVADTWTPTGSLGVARSGGTLSVLGDGRVLAAGGSDASATHSSAELWDPTAGTWSATAAMTGARADHSATVLANGRVLMAAGYLAPDYLATAELFSFDDTPPTITITTPPDGATYTLGTTVPADYACAEEAGGSGLASCVGPVADGSAIDTGTVGAKLFTVDAEDNAGNTASLTHDYTVAFDFDGLLSPVENLPVVNGVKAGAGVPVRFSLNGDQGLGILATGYPKSNKIACDSLAPQDALEETVTAGSSGLRYDQVADEYTYVWKTNKGWAGTCRQLNLRLTDGVDHVSNFKLK